MRFVLSERTAMKNESKSMCGIEIEICCGSVDDAVAAEQGGANRVELCSALFLGGLTPSMGAILEAKSRLSIPVIVMVRPRPSGFCYTSIEMEVMARDTENAIKAGADGVVFGILKEDSTVDSERCRRILDLIGDRQAVFHRAFDVAPDPFRALDELIALGVRRVLTSGQRSTAPQGANLIKRLIGYSRGRIEILPGGGIRLQTVNDLIEKTGCKQVHMTAFRPLYDASSSARPAVTFNGQLLPSESSYEGTDNSLVEGIVREIESRNAINGSTVPADFSEDRARGDLSLSKPAAKRENRAGVRF